MDKAETIKAPLQSDAFRQLSVEDKEAFICHHLYKMPVVVSSKGGWCVEGESKFKRRILTKLPGVLNSNYLEMLMEAMHEHYSMVLRLAPSGTAEESAYNVSWLSSNAKPNTCRTNYQELYEAMTMSALLALGLLTP